MKLIRRFIVMFLCCFFTVFLYDVKAVTKAQLPYEVLKITAGKTGFEISGWGLLAESQHFLNASTHTYALLIHDGSSMIRIPAKHTAVSQTALMQMVGTRKCGNSEYGASNENCYYEYQNVGFQAVIPYDQLSMNQQYTVSLEVHAKQVGRTAQIPLFFPSEAPAVHIDREFEYRAVSSLSSTQLRVSHYDTFVRRTPGNKTDLYTTNNVCSYVGGNRLYYDENSIFRSIFERRIVNETTYYRLAVQEAGCARNHRVVKEGNKIAPAWIPSSFVDYSGQALSIQTTINNHPPVITIHQNPVIDRTEVANFDPMRYVSAYDQEDGDLTNKIISSGEIKAIPGTYEKIFTVTDKYGAIDRKTMTVTVTKQNNTPPVIHAYDKIIHQYDQFDYLTDVSAIDREDGDLTKKITYQGRVDTKKLGSYELVYQVTDSEGETSFKKIMIQVIKNPREKIRYLSIRNPWYQEDIPANWIAQSLQLYDQLKHRYPYAEAVYES